MLGGLQDLRPRSEARILSVVINVVMDWMVLVAIVPLFRALGPGVSPGSRPTARWVQPPVHLREAL